MTYEEMEEDLDDIMLDHCDVEATELNSYRYDNNPYGLEYPLNVGSGGAVYDEDEYDKAVLLKWIDTFESDTCYSWIDIDADQDEEFTRRYKEHLKKKYKDLYGASNIN